MRYRNGGKCAIGEASSGILRETIDEKQDFGIYLIIVFLIVFDAIIFAFAYRRLKAYNLNLAQTMQSTKRTL